MSEQRFLKGGQLRAKKGDKPGITGVASVYNQEYDTGWFVETIQPGAFDDVLKSDPDVRCLFNHEPDNLLARTKSDTLRLEDSDEGLRYDADMPDTQLGRDIPTLIERGDLDGCSFSFDVGEDDWNTEYDDKGRVKRQTRTITKFAAVYDVGPVTFPAYSGTSVKARSLWPDGVPAEIRSRVPALRADEKKTKRIDDEDLTADCFLIVGDPDDTSTWHIPWKFSTDEKIKSHLRDALGRFDELKGVSDSVKKKAWKKLLRLCKQYGVDVDDDTKKKYSARSDESNQDQAECLKTLQAVAHKIKTDCEEIVQAIAGAVADPDAAIASCKDELEEIAKAAQEALDELSDSGGEDDDATRARRQRLRLARAF